VASIKCFIQVKYWISCMPHLFWSCFIADQYLSSYPILGRDTLHRVTDRCFHKYWCYTTLCFCCMCSVEYTPYQKRLRERRRTEWRHNFESRGYFSNNEPYLICLIKSVYYLKSMNKVSWYSKTPLIRTLVIQITNYPGRFDPSVKFGENPTKRTCLQITGYGIKYSTVLLASRTSNQAWSKGLDTGTVCK